MTLYYKIKSSISNDFKTLMKSGNYEKIVLDFMNVSKDIFPGKYIHLTEQSHGECDFVDEKTSEKFDAKFPLNNKQGKIIGSDKGNVGSLPIELYTEAVEFSHCFNSQRKKICDLQLYKIMNSIIAKSKNDENIIFFIPYPIVMDFEKFPLVGVQDILKKIYRELNAIHDLTKRDIFAIYVSFDNKAVLRNLKTDSREYLPCPELNKYVNYTIEHCPVSDE